MTLEFGAGQVESPFGLDDESRDRFEGRVVNALEWATRGAGRTFASVTVPIEASIDVAAVVLAARRADDRWFCFEQPDRDRYAVCGLGTAAVARSEGRGRFSMVAAVCRDLGAHILADDASSDPGRPPGSGPVFVGGFAFAPEGGRAPEWCSLAPAQLVLPEVAFARQGGEARMTLSLEVDGSASVDELLARAEARLADLRPATMPMLDPDPAVRPRVAAAAPPAHYEEAVQRAVERIRAGALAKVVLAREVRVHAPAPIDPAPILDALRGAFPACYSYCVGTPELAFLGASPELLVRRDGERAQTVALAGTTRRSADPAVDDHLGEQLLRSAKDRGEQQIVTERIERALDPVSLWVAAADEPVLVKVQNVQHLATPIRAQLADPIPVLELAGRLHPTPAVGGEPNAAVQPLIPALEGLDRGWYAGAVGWTDLAEDGELCVALRCALLRDDLAHLYAGCGIVADSIPADELAETEVKLQALLPLLA
ncbi:MAG TPA: isochorismate synthase [Thermoleophilaceae bacterium]|nr:isochorismate synthase [Thermoleophilaceae bacterium]